MIDNLLLDFFRENGRMIIPGKGIVLHVNIEDRNLDTVVFVNDTSMDGSEILEYIQKVLNTDSVSARKILDGYTALMDSVFAKNGEYVFEGVGTLRIDDKGAVYMVRHPECDGEDKAGTTSAMTDTMITNAVSSAALDKKEEEAVRKADEVHENNMTEDSELSEPFPSVNSMAANKEITAEERTQDAVGTEPVREFLDEMRENVAEESAMNEVKRLMEEKERHERLSEIFTSKRCFNDEAGDKRGDVSTLQMRLSNNEDAHIRSEKLEDLYKGDRYKKIADEHVEPLKENGMKTDVQENTDTPVKKKKRLDTVWIIFIIAVLGLIGVTIYWFYEKNTIEGNLNVPAVEEVIDQPVM